ncbi:ribosomal biogenesis factor [Procambarus clarkii]|uniref:ribosomal biogenesis factor n=1 Tax=Procambarus clarkii TaxID=6728 RepID=UPI001E6778FE|nr:uncharacterized protein LOC123766398 [Procambarus clarkii]XP_045611420.1 uncharacterized protein LOC123766398 [Procambarus clarkii]
MGKNKLHTRNPSKSGNPIYKKAGTGAPLKAKTKVKPVKTNLKQLKIANKEAIASLDKKLGSFHKAMQTKENSSFEQPVRSSEKDPPPVDMEETSEEPSKM